MIRMMADLSQPSHVILRPIWHSTRLCRQADALRARSPYIPTQYERLLAIIIAVSYIARVEEVVLCWSCLRWVSSLVRA
jgi:hypothetical protein